MTLPPLRARDEIVRAHDLLVHMVTHPELRVLIEDQTFAALLAHVDVLCWVLRHDHNEVFASRLAALGEAFAGLGYELCEKEKETASGRRRGGRK